MTVYDVVFKIRHDLTLERVGDSGSFRKSGNFFGSFDSFYQELSCEYYHDQQVNESVVHCVRTQTFFCFFVWDKIGNLHLLNSRSEVKRFFQQEDSM